MQVTLSITHGVRIFAEEHRLVETRSVLVHPLHAWVHLRIEVRVLDTAKWLAVLVAFIVDRTGRVECEGMVVAWTEVCATTSLIAKAPEDYRWTVAVQAYHAVDAIDKRRNPAWLLADRLVGMVFEVSLTYSIYAIMVEHCVHVRRIRIMRCAQSVDVVLLHHKHILQHNVGGDGTTQHRIGVMTVGALQEDALAIEVEQRSADLDFTQTVLGAECELFLAVGSGLNEMKSIEVRLLGTPQAHVLERELCLGISLCLSVECDIDVSFSHLLACRIHQFYRHLLAALEV